jgi:hypothetical protein
LLRGSSLSIRRYPFAWQQEQDAAEATLRAASVAFSVVEGDLIEQIEESDVVLFTSTSAGLEGILLGRVAIRIALDDIVTANPLEGRGFGDTVPHCSDARALQGALEHIASLDEEAYSRMADRQRQPATRVYSEQTPAVLHDLLIGRRIV